MTKHTPTTGPDTQDVTKLMDVFADTQIENIDEQITITEDQIIQRGVESVKTTADAGDIDKAKDLFGALLKKFPDNQKLSSQKKDLKQHISSKKIDAEIKQALDLYEQGEYPQAKKVLIQMGGEISQSQKRLYTECLNKIEKKLEEQEITAIDIQLQKAISLYDASEYAKAISLIDAIDPITDKQKEDKFEYSKKLDEKADEIEQQQIVVLRTQLAQDMYTKSTEDLVKDIEHIQALIKSIKNQDIRDTFSLFPEKDIIENLCKAYIQKDKAFGTIWVLGKKVDVDSIILRRLYKLENNRGYMERKNIDRVLGIHRPLLGLGEITVDDINTRLLVSTILKTYATKKNNNEIKTLLSRIATSENINQSQEDGWTLLMYAARDGHTDVVKLLLQHDVIYINKRNTANRMAALHLAAYNGNTDVVRLLLQCDKIKINTKDADGKTPYMLAKEQGHKDIVELLSQHPGIKI